MLEITLSDVEHAAEAETEFDYSAFESRTPEPDIQTLELWSEMGTAETPCGCVVEIGALCDHDNQDWLTLIRQKLHGEG